MNKVYNAPATPELDKMIVIQDQSELVSEFLDFFLNKYSVYEKKVIRDSAFVNVSTSDYINKEKLLAEFFEIDTDKMEQERRDLLEWLRKKTQD